MSFPFANALRWSGLVGILSVAIVRCIVAPVPSSPFQFDTVTGFSPIDGLTLAGSLWLDVALCLACACFLAGEMARGLDGLLLLLTGLPVPLLIYYGLTDALAIRRGATFATAALACASIAHAGRDPKLRRASIIILGTAPLPILIRGALQIGLEPGDGGNALATARPSGWFGSTNVFGSMAVATGLLWFGTALEAGRSAGRSRIGSVAIAVSSVLLGGLSRSAGALLASAAGLAMLVAPHSRAIAKRSALPWLGPVLLLVPIALGSLAVGVRGVALPERWAGETSLLFRAHTAATSARIVAAYPLTGVGPAGFPAAYLQHRGPGMPHVHRSAVSVFWDWLCMLGVCGLAWVAMTVLLIVRAGRALACRDHTRAASSRPPVAVIAVGIMAFAAAILVESCGAETAEITGRIVGLTAFIVAASIMSRLLREAPTRGWTLSAVAATLVAHAQIDISFTDHGLMIWSMCLLGLAGGVPTHRTTRPARMAVLAPAWAAAVGIALTIMGAVPATKQEQLVRAAVTELSPFAETRQTPREIGTVEADARRRAARLLLQADAAMPTAPESRIVAAFQLAEITRNPSTAGRADTLREALETLAPCLNGPHPILARPLATDVHGELFELTNDPAHARAMIRLARDSVAADQHGLLAWAHLGDLLWRVGDRADARHAYRRTLEIDARYAIKPSARLSSADRASHRASAEILKGRYMKTKDAARVSGVPARMFAWSREPEPEEKMKTIPFTAAIVTPLVFSVPSPTLAGGTGESGESTTVPRYDVFELTLTADGDYENPYLMMPDDDSSPGFVVATFVGPGDDVIEMEGFWYGDDIWKVRMAPTACGPWTFVTSSSDTGLDGVAGEFLCVPSENHGSLRIHPDNPFAFAYDDGTPFFWIGDTQVIFYDHGESEYRVDNGTFQEHQRIRAGQGMSVLCFGSWLYKKPGNFARNEGGLNFFGHPDQLNPDFWRFADDRLRYVVEAGLVPGLGIGWPDQNVDDFGDNRLLRGLRFLIARYGAYNVTWTIFGEANEYGSDWLEWTRRFGNALDRLDPYHRLATTHHGNRTAPYLGEDPWLDFNTQQRGGRGVPENSWNAIASDRLRGKPVCNVEFGYEDDESHDDLRRRAWMIAVHGGWFQWGDTLERENAGRLQMQYLAQFFRERTLYWLLQPNDEMIRAGSAYGSAVLARDYVIYLPDGRDVKVDTSDAEAWVLREEWLNPRTGSLTDGRVFFGSSTTEFSAPDDSADWVLHLSGGPDLNRDGRVGIADMLMLLAAWESEADHPADLNGSGSVELADLIILLTDWAGAQTPAVLAEPPSPAVGSDQ